MRRSKYPSPEASTSGSAASIARCRSANFASSSRPVAIRYVVIRWSYGKIEVVAPSSAPMLQMVALPVALIDRVPGPKYSMTALVAPDTLSRDANSRITSLGAAQPLSSPVSLTPIDVGYSTSHGRPAITSTASAPPTPTAQAPKSAGVRRMRVSAYDQLAWERVVLESDLVDDAGARSPEANAELRGGGAQELVDLLVLRERLAQVGRTNFAGLDEVIAVDGGRDSSASAPRLHELEHRRLPQHVLEEHSVRPELEIGLARLYRPAQGRLVQVREEHLVSQTERPAVAGPPPGCAPCADRRRPRMPGWTRS